MAWEPSSLQPVRSSLSVHVRPPNRLCSRSARREDARSAPSAAGPQSGSAWLLPSTMHMLLAPRYLPRPAALVGLFTRYGLADFAKQQGLIALSPDSAEPGEADAGVTEKARA